MKNNPESTKKPRDLSAIEAKLHSGPDAFKRLQALAKKVVTAPKPEPGKKG